MPQILQVLKCYICDTFQVHIVKKNNTKWQCKICEEKQSVQKIYGQGSGKDCRVHVQKLNALRATSDNSEIEFGAPMSMSMSMSMSAAATNLDDDSFACQTKTYSNLEEDLVESEDSMDINQEIYDNLDSLNNVNKNKENRYSKHIYSPVHNYDTQPSKWTKYLDASDLNKLRLGNNLNRSDLYEATSTDYLSNFSSSNSNNKTNNNRHTITATATATATTNCFDTMNNEDLDQIFQI